MLSGEGLSRPPLDHQLPFLKVYSHGSTFSISIGTETAPAPLIGCTDQSAFHRVAVDVAQFLNPLAVAPDIEVIETLLPDSFVLCICPESSLCLGRTSLVAQLARESLFENLFENLHKPVAGTCCAQNRQPVITTASDEMEVLRAVVALQPCGHTTESKQASEDESVMHEHCYTPLIRKKRE
jgi:hypothetical protein